MNTHTHAHTNSVKDEVANINTYTFALLFSNLSLTIIFFTRQKDSMNENCGEKKLPQPCWEAVRKHREARAGIRISSLRSEGHKLDISHCGWTEALWSLPFMCQHWTWNNSLNSAHWQRVSERTLPCPMVKKSDKPQTTLSMARFSYCLHMQRCSDARYHHTRILWHGDWEMASSDITLPGILLASMGTCL